MNSRERFLLKTAISDYLDSSLVLREPEVNYNLEPFEESSKA